MPSQDIQLKDIDKALRRPLFLTRAGMVAERLVRAFWPLWSVGFLALAPLMLGLQDLVRIEIVWAFAAVFAALIIVTLFFAVRRFRWPSRDSALVRLDATLKGNPIQAVLDKQVVGTGDAASLAVWQAHQQRMQARLAEARAVEPNLRVARSDPFALRYVALLALFVAALFGSVLKVQSVAAMGPAGAASLGAPTWEGWVEPPGYTRLPSVYLNDIADADLKAAQGSKITLRLYGTSGVLAVAETVSGAPLETSRTETAQDFSVLQSGELELTGPGGRAWDIVMLTDASPTIERAGEIEVTYEGQASIPFMASDDYGVVAGSVRITLDSASVDRRYGLRADPEIRAGFDLPLPMPIAGSRAAFTEHLIDNFSQHPWANLPVLMEYRVEDAAGQKSATVSETIDLPGRRFFDTMASAVIEQRQALLWSRENSGDVALILRAVAHRPDDIFRSAVTYLRFKTILQRLETFSAHKMTVVQRDEIAEAMWELALILEEGDLSDALERLQRAQDRLSEAMKNGASDQEIAELMQEMRRASDEYLRQLSQQAQQEAEQDPNNQQAQQNQNSMQMSQDDLQRMMDRIQELMEEGRMDEAQEALDQLREMMENMQVTEGQQGQGQQSPGEQAMEGLADTLREQQGLSDEAFRDLQEQFNPNAQQGQSAENRGRNGGEGQGQQHEGQRGEGRGEGSAEGQGNGQEQSEQGQGGQPSGQDLADRQQTLRDELNRQRNGLPGQNSEAGDRAADALERAEDAMGGAEQALRDGDLAEAIDQQSAAMEALREGLRDLGEAMAEQQQQNQGQQGLAEGSEPGQQRDPLGRNAGTNGQIGSDEGLLQGEDVYRRARELLDEIRRRTGEGARPEVELDYLERLLDRF